MGLFKKLAGLLGLAKDEDQQHRDGDAAAETAAPPPFSVPSAAAATASAQHLPRRGFSVPVQVPVERGPPPPLLVFCPSGDGGVQCWGFGSVNALANKGFVKSTTEQIWLERTGVFLEKEMDTVTNIKYLDAEFSISLSDIQRSCMGRGRATLDDFTRKRADRLNFVL